MQNLNPLSVHYLRTDLQSFTHQQGNGAKRPPRVTRKPTISARAKQWPNTSLEVGNVSLGELLLLPGCNREECRQMEAEAGKAGLRLGGLLGDRLGLGSLLCTPHASASSAWSSSPSSLSVEWESQPDTISRRHTAACMTQKVFKTGMLMGT